MWKSCITVVLQPHCVVRMHRPSFQKSPNQATQTPSNSWRGSLGTTSEATSASRASTKGIVGSTRVKRALLLLCCFAVGCGVALGGWLFSGSQLWFLAVPAVVAIGWLFVADPSRCVQEPQNRSRNGRGAA
jgi:hypothetical protein